MLRLIEFYVNVWCAQNDKSQVHTCIKKNISFVCDWLTVRRVQDVCVIIKWQNIK